MSRGFTYTREVRHAGLNKYRLITGHDRYVVEQKANAQCAAWDEQWESRLKVEQKKTEREKRAYAKEARKALAAERTTEAEQAITELKNILVGSLQAKQNFDWEKLKDKSRFTEKKPAAPKLPHISPEPYSTESQFLPRLGILGRIFSSIRDERKQKAEKKFELAHQAWERNKKELETIYELCLGEYSTDLEKWEKRKQEFQDNQTAQHNSIENLKERYLNGEAGAVEEYNDFVLARSEYPDLFPKEYELSFTTTDVLIIEYRLPALADLPTLKQVRYIASRDVFEDVSLKESELNSLYDSILYQTSLRTIHEVFKSDQIQKIKACVFNGWVEFTDPANGNYPVDVLRLRM